MKFDLFLLTIEELQAIKLEHHGPFDDSRITNTEINIVQQFVTIGTCLTSIDRPWARKLLETMQKEGRTSFSLSEEFIQLCEVHRVGIDFEGIASQLPRENCIFKLLEINPDPEREFARRNPET